MRGKNSRDSLFIPYRKATMPVFIRLLAGICLLWSSFCPGQSTFPSQPIHIIVPYPAGGPNDVLARMLGDQLSSAFSQQSVIENRAGGGGNIATELAARAKPDGHTLVLPAMAYAVNPSLYNKVPYRFSDFTPLTIVAKGPLVLPT